MKARPILMHARSIQNLLAGRKTQTRRILKNLAYSRVDGIEESEKYPGEFVPWIDGEPRPSMLCPYGVPGDLLWVRETFCVGYDAGDGTWTALPFKGCEKSRRAFYRATDDDPPDEPQRPWKPSIHMPRWASRLTLRLTEVRVERVQDISDEDCEAEGIERPHTPPPYRDATGELVLPYTRTWHGAFRSLWENTNGAGAWERNDWTWALSFEVLRENVDAVLARGKAAA